MENYKCFQKGYLVALSLTEETAPIRSYVREIQEIDSKGIRITLIDWLVGNFSHDDLFVSWENIKASLIATPEHDKSLFIESAIKWQGSIEEQETRREIK